MARKRSVLSRSAASICTRSAASRCSCRLSSSRWAVRASTWRSSAAFATSTACSAWRRSSTSIAVTQTISRASARLKTTIQFSVPAGFRNMSATTSSEAMPATASVRRHGDHSVNSTGMT